MLNLRTLKRIAARVLPEAVKARMRGRLYGYRPARVSLDVRALGEADGVATVMVDGIRLRLPADAVKDTMYHLEGNGESVEELHALLHAARTVGGTLWDVGAHRGVLSVLFCLAREGNAAVGWEPAGSTAEGARELAALNGLADRVAIRQAAVGDDRVSRPGFVDALGFLRMGEGEGAETVAFTTLDDEAEALGAGPTVLKIDVEGHEGAVLRGGRTVLDRWKPVVFLELHLDLLERGDGVAPVADALVDAGYAMETMTGRALSRREVVGLPYAIYRLVARHRGR